MESKSIYFSHDANARHDSKLIALRIRHDWKGYGLYWAIIEKLRDSKHYKLIQDYNLLAYDLRTDAGTIKSIVTEFGLFVTTNDGYFYSESLNNRMELVESKSEQAKKAIAKRWENKKTDNEQVNTDVIRTYNERNTDVIQLKESKVKESKVNKIKEKEFTTVNNTPTNFENSDLVLGEEKNLIPTKQEEKEKPPRVATSPPNLNFVKNENWRVLMDEWVKYRKAIKKPYKLQIQLEKSFESLVSDSNNDINKARLIINQSIKNGWQGLFQLKDDNNNNNNNYGTKREANDAELMRIRQQSEQEISDWVAKYM